MANVPRGRALVVGLMMGLLVLAVVFAGVFVIQELDHDCTGEHCHICLEIRIVHILLEAFERLGMSMLLAGFILYARTLIKPLVFFCSITPVELKIKLTR
jgi:hypothetical protein